MTLFGKKVFADIIKHFEIILDVAWTPNPITYIIRRRRGNEMFALFDGLQANSFCYRYAN